LPIGRERLQHSHLANTNSANLVAMLVQMKTPFPVKLTAVCNLVNPQVDNRDGDFRDQEVPARTLAHLDLTGASITWELR
jgi:hypothetical protein